VGKREIANFDSRSQIVERTVGGRALLRIEGLSAPDLHCLDCVFLCKHRNI